MTRINSDGSYGWTRVAAAPGNDISKSVAVDSTGNIYTCGYFTSSSVDFAEDWGGSDEKMCAGGREVFILKITQP